MGFWKFIKRLEEKFSDWQFGSYKGNGPGNG